MRRLYTLFIMASLSLASAIAQNGTGIVGDDYYRVHNYATGRYIYVTDNKDYYDMTHDREDFQAIQLWKDASKTISDPATVIYIKKVGSKYDLQAQGTGIHQLTHTDDFDGYYVTIEQKSDGTYEVYAQRANVTKYLTDDRTSSDRPQGQLGTSGKATARRWVVDKIDVNHATNYFGITPTIELNGKYYQPFYAVFPFRTASPDMHVYYINQVTGSDAIMKEISGDVPGETPVIIECSSTDPSNNRIELLSPNTAKITDNKLVGVYFCNGDRPAESVDAYTEFNASTMRVLTVSGGKLTFSNNAPDRLKEIEAVDWTTEDDITVTCIPANTCYLKADAGTPAVLNACLEGSGIDEILAERKDNNAEGVYTISGTQLRTTNDVQGLPAGLYIVGGVKFVIK
ncbi:MAG: hypothetical protein IKW91_05070 [Bacteroidaceae bacterium]|nr:hypothetical protein [Bacteroidaceae bacterium]